MNKNPFAPEYGATVAIAQSASSTSANVPTGTKQLCLTNTGPAVAFVRVSQGASTATGADFPILPNTHRLITRFQDWGVVSVIWSAAGSGTLYVTPGEGYTPGGV